MSNKPSVEYIPPEPKVIDDYARRVCDAAGITDREIRFGYANFLKFAAQAVAKQLTKQHNQTESEDTHGE